jgi:transcriptional regulator with XRE-family HTH domain
MSNRGKSGSQMPMAHLDICDRIKLLRLESKLTQREFAEKIGATESYIKQVETRTFTPNIYFLKQIRKVTGVSYDWLIDGHGPKK